MHGVLRHAIRAKRRIWPSNLDTAFHSILAYFPSRSSSLSALVARKSRIFNQMRRGQEPKIPNVKIFFTPSPPTTYRNSSDKKIANFRLECAGSSLYRGASFFARPNLPTPLIKPGAARFDSNAQARPIVEGHRFSPLAKKT